MRLVEWATPIDTFLIGAIIGAAGVPLFKKGLRGLAKRAVKAPGQIKRKPGQGTFWWTGIIAEARERHQKRIAERALKAACPSAGVCGNIQFGPGSEF
ncbi:MAG: hypothetical protein BWY80_00529 [Firmicutes bacterium ADurb.Bin456]|nr:MAG: hypothetical protein BWY80_00529 [Firmicutes bacterium ADurb.Bin456]